VMGVLGWDVGEEGDEGLDVRCGGVVVFGLLWIGEGRRGRR
jgi:hypothetical protein